MSHPETDNARPTLGRGPAAKGAIDAVTAFLAELQAGWDRHDVDISNRHFAADVAWGSPYGATVHGYEQLHAIHQRLKAQGTGGPSSRFEIDRVLPVTDDVPSPTSPGAPSAPTANSSNLATTTPRRSPRWLSTSWSAATEPDGWPQDRTPPCNQVERRSRRRHGIPGEQRIARICHA
jgi:hypothetical protein